MQSLVMKIIRNFLQLGTRESIQVIESERERESE